MNIKGAIKSPFAYYILLLAAFIAKEKILFVIGEVSLDILIYCILLPLALIFSITYLLSQIRPYYLLYKDAKFRGVLPKHLLDAFVYKHTFASSVIKIKVTRAHSLFVLPGNQSFKKVIDEIASSSKHKDKEIEFQLLLHVPCQISEHVKSRANANSSANNLEGFIKTWFETLKALDNCNKNESNKISFNVKFYSEKHTRWRFFLFKTPDLNESKMLFDYYDSNSPSYREDMYCVAQGEQSLLSKFESYFDHLWGDSNEAIDAFTYIEHHFGKTDNCLTKCSGCSHKTNCHKIKTEYQTLFTHND